MLGRVTRVVGLTGGIGTGKSTVARLLAGLGACVIDADAIVHELQAPGTPLLAKIVEAFGEDMRRSDGSLDRERFGRLVFADPAARRRLNELVHPAVGAEMLRRLAAARAAGVPLVVLDIPLLLEGRGRASEARTPNRGSASGEANGATTAGDAPRPRGASDLVSEVIVVYAREAQQIERQVARDGATPEHARERVAAQLPIEEKRRLADHVIDNSGSLADTERQVRALYAKLTAA
jgi:dephospho-CoA kinase